MNLPDIDQVEFEESGERLKVIMPLRRKPAYLVIYALLLLVWVGTTFWLLGLLLRQPVLSMRPVYVLVYVLIVLVWAYIWYRLGKHVLRYFEYYAATREILFIDSATLIIRRPMIILGVTDAYDMAHVGPFEYNDHHAAAAFEYGSRGGLFGSGLQRSQVEQLIDVLNRRYFARREPQPEEDIFL